jgi:hypothetical protein
MLHTLLIIVHAASATLAFLLGLVVLRPPAQGVPPAFRAYVGTLWLMILFLILVVAVDWLGVDLLSRFLYTALAALALYTGWRGWQAWEALRHRKVGWRPGYIDHVGFTLITLFVGFVIVSAIDLAAPVWLAVLLGALVVLIGRLGVQRAKETMTTDSLGT